MKRAIQAIGALMAGLALSIAVNPVLAGRMEGPTSVVATAPVGLSVYYDMTLVAGEPTVMTVIGNGRSILFVMIYDADGHVAVGAGSNDRKMVSMDVYRTGVFRVEVRNIGVADDTFTLSTN